MQAEEPAMQAEEPAVQADAAAEEPAMQAEEPAGEAAWAEPAEQASESVSEEKSADSESADFMAEIDKSFVYIKRGQIVSGTVVQISDNELCVNIGYKSDGILKKENLTATGDVDPADMFKVGDEIEAEVVTLNDGEGNVVLSRRSIESKLKWKELIENLDESRIYTVRVDKVVKGGVLAKLDGYDAFIPASQLSLKYVEDLSEFVDKDLEVSVIEADKRQRRFVLSHKNILQKQAEEDEKRLYETFKKGDKINGKVKRLTDFGAFVDVGGIDGLLHITDIAWARVKHPSDALSIGDNVEVLILNVDPEKKRISLGLKQLQPKPWDLAPEKYIVGDTVEGTVVRIMPFGAFISLEPTIDGLVHISQVTNRRLEKVEEELRIGDKVTARVMEVNPSKKRISLSIRALMDEPERAEKEKPDKRDKEERFHFEIPPVEEATSSLADFFPKADEED
jgi:4-hydroxy-3-methylbut-2-enyl diphosphate reductase